MMVTIVRPQPEPFSAAAVLARQSSTCQACAAGERHPFNVQLIPAEGPAWERTIVAIGHNDARNIANDQVAGDPDDVRVGRIDHAPITALDDEEDDEAPDAIDEWKAYRDAGLSESELRWIGGDR